MPIGGPPPLRIPSEFWEHEPVRDALAARDVAALFGYMRRYLGASQSAIGAATLLEQGAISKIMNRRQNTTSFALFERIANGLDMPDDVRIRFGLAPRGGHVGGVPGVDIGRRIGPTPVGRPAVAVEASAETSGRPGIRDVERDSMNAETSRSQLVSVSKNEETTLSDQWDDGDPSLILHWETLLRMLSAHENLLGAASVYQVAQGEYNLIRERRKRISGNAVPALTRVEARWAEFCSWTAENSGDYAKTARWLEFALQLAERANARSTAAYVRMRQAQRAAERGDADQVIRLATEAAETRGISKRDQALCLIRQAEGYALRGDQTSCTSSIGHADRLLTQVLEQDQDDPDTIGGHASLEYLAAHESRCRLLLGDVSQAVAGFEAVLDGWPFKFRLDEALTRAWLGLAYLAAGRLEEAATQGTRALNIAGARPSARTFRALSKLHRKLEPSDDSAIVAFRAAYGRAPQPHYQDM